MRLIKTCAFARAGLLGNPSDGYFGKTLAVNIRDFSARVVLYEWPELEIVLGRQDRCEYAGLSDLVEDVKLNGLYGGLRLIKAAVKKFAEHCQAAGLSLPEQNFALRYETDIPRQVGLAGSSAIITAVFRALTEFYQVRIEREILPTLILEVESREIGIQAGLQDRVAQTYEGLVYMDFDRSLLETLHHGRYESLDTQLLPPLYLAYRSDLSEISGVVHSNLRLRWERGDPDVLEAMQELAEITEAGKASLLKGDTLKFAALMDRNFDVRARILKLDARNVEMVHLARSLGVCANYAGSGGSIVGICPEEDRFRQLQAAFQNIGCQVIRPRL